MKTKFFLLLPLVTILDHYVLFGYLGQELEQTVEQMMQKKLDGVGPVDNRPSTD